MDAARPELCVAFFADDEVEARRQLGEWADAEPRLVAWRVLDGSRDARRFSFILRVSWAEDQGRLAV